MDSRDLLDNDEDLDENIFVPQIQGQDLNSGSRITAH